MEGAGGTKYTGGFVKITEVFRLALLAPHHPHKYLIGF